MNDCQLCEMKFEEAQKYFEDTGCGLANGPNNTEALEFINKLYELGAEKVEVGLHDHYDEDEYEFDSEIYVHLPNLNCDLLEAIVLSRPNECDHLGDNIIRLWWD